MGWNKGFTIFEQTVIGAYDLGVLDKALLKVLMRPYSGTDIDMGGCCYLQTEDGKEIEQVVIETWGLKMPKEPKLPEDTSRWTEADSTAWNAYLDAVYEKFRRVTEKFGWR